MRKRRRWTKEEDDYLRKNYQLGCIEEMADYLGVTANLVRTRSVSLGLSRAKASHRTEYAMYNGDEFEMIGTAYEIGKALGIKPESVSWYASKTAYERMEKNPEGKGRVAVRL